MAGMKTEFKWPELGDRWLPSQSFTARVRGGGEYRCGVWKWSSRRLQCRIAGPGEANFASLPQPAASGEAAVRMLLAEIRKRAGGRNKIVSLSNRDKGGVVGERTIRKVLREVAGDGASLEMDTRGKEKKESDAKIAWMIEEMMKGRVFPRYI